MSKNIKQFRFYNELGFGVTNAMENGLPVYYNSSTGTVSRQKETGDEEEISSDKYYTITRNYPYNISISKLSTNSADLFRSCLPIKQLGIQTLPGTKFYLNFSPLTNPIIIGNTGIFELNLENSSGIITDLYFDQTSLQQISDLDTGYLIVDIVYETEDE